MIVIEFWDFNLHVVLSLHFVYVYSGPYDCSDNHDDYMFYLSKLFQIIDEFQSPYIFVCGDFNANIRSPSQFGDDLLQLCSDNSLCLADALFLPRNTFNNNNLLFQTMVHMKKIYIYIYIYIYYV